MNTIQFDIFDQDQLSEHITIGASVYSCPEVIDPDHLRWKHLQNPYGSSTSISLRNEFGVLIGRSFIQPRTFWVTPFASCCGATITDLVIMPAERSAESLIGMTRAIKSPEGVDVVVHTSNDNSDLIYRKLFKFPVAFTLTAIGLPLRVSNILKSYFTNQVLIKVVELLVSPWRLVLGASALIMGAVCGIRLAAQPTADVMSEIFEEYRQHAGSHFERGQHFLEWRFSSGPLFNGKIEWVWSQGQCVGYLAFKRVVLGGLDIFVILDVVLRRRLTLQEGIALKFIAARLAIDSSCDAIFTLVNLESPALKWLKGFPFFHIPDRHLPHPTPIFIHASNEHRSLEKQADVFFTLADLDYF
ncbi:MAG: hypothetical protein Q8R06_17815 [Polaromonas sp.]|uniref:hypothetical protein n=1 Tax=Polaromonas sp. TaxID=1869339 RepID=UPI0027344A9D|nr:hypothetical protein [Polaromonas sp.]MDP3798974.1 hypothetical protein [Polaromonas sp.]